MAGCLFAVIGIALHTIYWLIYRRAVVDENGEHTPEAVADVDRRMWGGR
jgi:hypothetical protein